MDPQMTEFLAARPVAVVGASSRRKKFGNIILRNLRERGWTVYAVNPRETEIEGEPCYATLADCPQRPALAVMVVPPAVTLQVLEEAAAAGVGRVWLQDGTWNQEVLDRARELGLREVHDACIMVQAARLS